MTGGTLGHEYFEELCALSSIGQISVSEYQELTEHLRSCAACRDSHADFVELTHGHMPLLAAETPEIKDSTCAVISSYKEAFVEAARARGLELAAKSPEASWWS